MNRKTKIWLIIAWSLLLAGIIIFGSVMTTLKWDFTKLSTTKYETISYEINEKYNNISVLTKTADVLFLPSKSGETSVICMEEKNTKHNVTVQNDTLVIEAIDTRKWYEHIGINFGNAKITVYIPQGEYGALSVKSDTGDIEIPKEFEFQSIAVSGSTSDVNCYSSVSDTVDIKLSTGDINLQDIRIGNAKLTVSTGDINLKSVNCDKDLEVNVDTGKTKFTDVLCDNVISKGDTGDMALYNVIAKKGFSITRDTGDVIFEKSDAAEINVKTSTGDVKGTLLSSKVFIAESVTGDVKVPKTTSGGKCEINTNTGDINITVN